MCLTGALRLEIPKRMGEVLQHHNVVNLGMDQTVDPGMAKRCNHRKLECPRLVLFLNVTETSQAT